MSNSFSKETMVAFDQEMASFEDQLIISSNVTTKQLGPQDAERANDTFWVPQPYIVTSVAATDLTSYFLDVTEMSVPVSLNNQSGVPFKLSIKNVRDGEQEAKLVKAAIAKLASDINKSISTVAAAQGSIVVTRTNAAGSYDDISIVESVFNEQGIAPNDRFGLMNTRDYNGLAKDLAVATRSLSASKSLTAYEKSLIGDVAGFQLHKGEYTTRQAVAAPTNPITIDTRATATANHYIPVATASYLSGQVNVDNRFQTITVSATAGVVAGDSFTIAGCYAVNHITKDSTGVLKTFRVVSVTDGTHLVICPPIISNQATAANQASAQYKNVNITTLAAASAITFLNTVAAPSNIFWHKDAIILVPGRYSLSGGDGTQTISARTANGLEIVVSKQRNILTQDTYIRADAIWGCVVANPEMVGVEYFNQSAATL